MSEENATLDPAASTEVEQPALEEQAVEPGESVQEEAPGTELEQSVTETPQPKLYAGKYKTVEELEAAYQNTSSEASRMAQRLAGFEKPATPKTEAPKFTQDQLETFKEGRLLEVTQAQNLAAAEYAKGNITQAQQYEAQARESARQIRLIDAELRKLDIANTLQSSTKQAAEQRLLKDAVGVLKQYQSDLTPGTELYTKASEFMDGYIAMGMDPENPLVQAQAVSMAAQLLGLSSKRVEQTTRKELTQNISKALKQGVIQGAGKAGKTSSAAPDFLKMTDAEFKAYKAARGWD